MLANTWETSLLYFTWRENCRAVATSILPLLGTCMMPGFLGIYELETPSSNTPYSHNPLMNLKEMSISKRVYVC